MEKRIAPIKAGQKPIIVKPLIKVETNQKRKPLMIRVKSPRVKILIGSVRIMRIGRMRALTMPRAKAAIRAV